MVDGPLGDIYFAFSPDTLIHVRLGNRLALGLVPLVLEFTVISKLILFNSDFGLVLALLGQEEGVRVLRCNLIKRVTKLDRFEPE